MPAEKCRHGKIFLVNVNRKTQRGISCDSGNDRNIQLSRIQYSYKQGIVLKNLFSM